MEKQADTTLHERDNVVPFRRREKRESSVAVKQTDVEVLLCSLCGSKDFMLLAEASGQIACSNCGFLIGANWQTDYEIT